MPGSTYTPDSAAANLIGALVYFTLFGFYVCLVITTAYILRSRRAKISPPLIATGILFVVTLILTAAAPVCLYHAYVTYPDGPQAYWAGYTAHALDLGISGLGNFCFTISTTIAEMMLVWRTYIVWNRNRYVLVFPVLTCIVCIPAGFAVCGFLIAFANPSNWKYGDIAENLAILSFCNVVAGSWYSTGMICGRLWYMHKQLRQYNDQPTPYIHVIAVLVESGGAYSLFMLLYLLVTFIPMTGAYQGFASTILINICSMMIAIVPTMVILRLSLGHLQPADAPNTFSRPRHARPQELDEEYRQPSRAVQVIRGGQTTTIMTGPSIHFAGRSDARRVGQSISFFEPTVTADLHDASSFNDATSAKSSGADVKEGIGGVEVAESPEQQDI